MRDNPCIYASCAVKRTKAKTAKSTNTPSTKTLEDTKQKGDLLIRHIFQNGTDSDHDMQVVNTDDKSHSANTPEKCLQEAERAKKNMYLEACLQKWRNF